EVGLAKVDRPRALRGGGAEAVFCPGKTPEQVVAIVERLAVHHPKVLATRADADIAAAVAAAALPHVYHRLPRLLIVRPELVEAVGLVVVASAGTADLPVADEAALGAEALGDRGERLAGCGRAGPRRRCPP